MQFTQSFQMRLNSTTKKKSQRQRISEVLKGQMFFVIFLTCLRVLSVRVVANKKPQSLQMKIEK